MVKTVIQHCRFIRVIMVVMGFSLLRLLALLGILLY
jgi:hypothetical protein